VSNYRAVRIAIDFHDLSNSEWRKLYVSRENVNLIDIEVKHLLDGGTSEASNNSFSQKDFKTHSSRCVLYKEQQTRQDKK
jgi:hypothetical protein